MTRILISRTFYLTLAAFLILTSDKDEEPEHKITSIQIEVGHDEIGDEEDDEPMEMGKVVYREIEPNEVCIPGETEEEDVNEDSFELC